MLDSSQEAFERSKVALASATSDTDALRAVGAMLMTARPAILASIGGASRQPGFDSAELWGRVVVRILAVSRREGMRSRFCSMSPAEFTAYCLAAARTTRTDASRAEKRSASVPLDLLAETIADPAPGPETVVERRFLWEAVWSEVKVLKLIDRQVLLLGSLGELDLAHRLVQTGVASVRQIAEQIGWPALHLAQMWPSLPLEGAAFIEQVAPGKSASNVALLRHRAWRRLRVRMKRWDEEEGGGLGRGRER